MTNKDVRTPASSQTDGASSPSLDGEAGKSIGWHKAYIGGTRPDLRVPVRQVHLTNGQSVTLYDTSGPYTDPAVDTDVRRGLAPLRESWIIARVLLGVSAGDDPVLAQRRQPPAHIGVDGRIGVRAGGVVQRHGLPVGEVHLPNRHP